MIQLKISIEYLLWSEHRQLDAKGNIRMSINSLGPKEAYNNNKSPSTSYTKYIKNSEKSIRSIRLDIRKLSFYS